MTARLNVVETTAATGPVKDMYDAVQKQIKMVPNLFKVFGNSPKVLEGYLALSGALAHDSLPAKLRELLAITVAEENRCDYCLSAHTTMGKAAGLSDTDTQAAQTGKSSDAKYQAALTFARAVVEKHGQVSDSDIQSVRSAGYNDAQIVEIIAHVSLNILTNYTNNIAKTVIDFPVAHFATTSKAA